MTNNVQINQKKQVSNVSVQKFQTLQMLDKMSSTLVPRCDCKFCNSKLRVEAQQLFQKTNKMISVQRFFQQKGIKISYPAIRNHLTVHYGAQAKSSKIQQYKQDLKGMLSIQVNKRQFLDQRIVMLTRQMMSLSVQTNSLSMDERRKTNDTIVKLNQSISKLIDQRQDMDKQMQPFYIVLQALKQIVSTRIKDSQSIQVKKELQGLISDLKVHPLVKQLLLDKPVNTVKDA